MKNTRRSATAVTIALAIGCAPVCASQMTWQEHVEAAQAQWQFHIVDPVSPVAHLEKAVVLARQEKVAASVEGHLLDLLAQGYLLGGNTGLQEKTLLAAVRLKERRLGPQSPELVPTLYQLGDLRLQQKRRDEYLDLYKRGLQIQRNAFGNQSPQVAEALVMLGSAYGGLEAPKEEEAYLRQAVLIARSLPETEVEARGTSLAVLAGFLREQGRRAEADSLDKEAGPYLERVAAKQRARNDGREYRGLAKNSPSDVTALDPRDPRWQRYRAFDDVKQVLSDGH